MALRLSSKFNTNIVIDGEVIPLRIKRIDPNEARGFNRDFGRYGRRAALPELPATATEDERKKREAEDEVTEEEASKFVVSSISDFVEVHQGSIIDDDTDKDITSGSEVCRMFGARQDVLSELLMLIFMENKLNAEQKANWRTRLAPFVPTPEKVANRMMDIGKVTDADVVYDLGCGAGALCVAAAKRGAKAHGWDIDADRIEEARAAADTAGVSHLCTFTHGDALQVDLSGATVVTLYLLAGANIKLRPILLSALPNGARVISHAFTMGGEWVPDLTEDVPLDEGEERVHGGQRQIYVYSVDRWRKAHPALKLVSELKPASELVTA